MTDDVSMADEKKSLAAKLLRPKVAIPLLIVILLVLSPFLIRGWYLGRVPDFPEPFDAKPLLEYAVPDDENAFTDYRKAVSLYSQPSREINDLRDRIDNEGWQLASDEIRQFLDDNEDALLAWKSGAEKDKALYILAKEFNISVSLEVVQEMRELHRTAMLLCKQLEAEGNPREAWEWYRVAIRASRHIGTRGGIVQRLVGAACFQLSAANLERWATHPGLTSADLQVALEQLQQDWRLTEKNSTTFKIEYLSLSRALEENREKIAAGFGMKPAVSSSFYYFIAEPELSKRMMRFYFHNHLQFCDLTRYQRPDLTEPPVSVYDDPAGFQIDQIEWSGEEFHKSSLRAFLFVLIRPADFITESFDEEEARCRSLLVCFAGQAFFRDHGRFPNALDELVPEYLHEIPIDNYDGEPLKYRFDPGGPIVYSVYKNLSDERGLEWSREKLPRGKGWPDDYGSQMRLPDPEPLTAPKPTIP